MSLWRFADTFGYLLLFFHFLQLNVVLLGRGPTELLALPFWKFPAHAFCVIFLFRQSPESWNTTLFPRKERVLTSVKHGMSQVTPMHRPYEVIFWS